MPVFIYSLKDPTTGDVRYIGQSNNPKKRLAHHLNGSIKEKNHLGYWLKTLVARQEKPILAVLHEVTEKESWAEEERRYISCARAMGVDLVNATDGGEGGPNPTPETRVKMCKAQQNRAPLSEKSRALISASKIGSKNAFFGKKHTPESLALISAASAGSRNPFFGKTHTSESLKLMSDANMGKTIPPEQRAAISASTTGTKNHFFGKHHTSEARAQIGAKSGASRLGKKRGKYRPKQAAAAYLQKDALTNRG